VSAIGDGEKSRAQIRNNRKKKTRKYYIIGPGPILSGEGESKSFGYKITRLIESCRAEQQLRQERRPRQKHGTHISRNHDGEAPGQGRGSESCDGQIKGHIIGGYMERIRDHEFIREDGG